MKKIEITTPQNVTVQYTLATPWERGLAVLVDACIIFVSAMVLFLLLTVVARSAADPFMYILVVPLVIFYSLAFELFNNGRSPGKQMLQLRVIRMDGVPPRFLDYLMRWVFRGVDLYFSFGSIGLISATSSRYTQRLGDLLANTVVVNVGKSDRVPLHNLMSLDRLAGHKVTFPNASRLPESTMLLVKETLDRSAEFDNAAHSRAVELLSQKLQRELRVKQVNDQRAFLQKVLTDFVVLTR